MIRPLKKTILIVDEMQIMFRNDITKFAIMSRTSRTACMLVVMSATPAATFRAVSTERGAESAASAQRTFPTSPSMSWKRPQSITASTTLAAPGG